MIQVYFIDHDGVNGRVNSNHVKKDLNRWSSRMRRSVLSRWFEWPNERSTTTVWSSDFLRFILVCLTEWSRTRSSPPFDQELRNAWSFTRALIIWRPKHNLRDPTCSPNTPLLDGQSNYPCPSPFTINFSISSKNKPKTSLLHPLNSTNPPWNSLFHHLVFEILSQSFEVFIQNPSPNAPYHSLRIRSPSPILHQKVTRSLPSLSSNIQSVSSSKFRHQRNRFPSALILLGELFLFALLKLTTNLYGFKKKKFISS